MHECGTTANCTTSLREERRVHNPISISSQSHYPLRIDELTLTLTHYSVPHGLSTCRFKLSMNLTAAVYRYEKYQVLERELGSREKLGN